VQVRTSSENAIRETLTNDNNYPSKPGSLEDLFSGYFYVLMSRPPTSWCKIMFSEQKGHSQGGGRKGCLWGSAIAKGWWILGPPREMAKGSLSLLWKGRMMWPPMGKQVARCLHVLVTPSFHHADIFPSKLISLQLPLLPLYTVCNLTLRPGSTSFLPRGHLDRA